MEFQVEELTKSAEEVELMGMDTKTSITMDAIKQKLIDTEEKLGQNAALTGRLIAKERECNDELQEARQELISVSRLLLDYPMTSCASGSYALAESTYQIFAKTTMRPGKCYCLIVRILRLNQTRFGQV